MSDKPPIQSSRDILGGAPVFAGTRVTIQTLFDHLEADESLDDFLRDFPSVKREQAQEVLEFSKAALIRDLDEPPS